MRIFTCLLALCASLMFNAPHAFAQAVTPGGSTVIATSDEDGTPTAQHTSYSSGHGDLMLHSAIGGVWAGVESARVTAEVKFTNPSNVPIRIEELRGEFKRGATINGSTLFVATHRGETIRPGTTRSLILTYENLERYDQVSVDLSVTYQESGRVHAQHVFLKGNKQQRSFEVMNQLFNGLLPVPVGIGNYPITAGPMYPWPSEYDMQIRQDNTGVFKIHF